MIKPFNPNCSDRALMYAAALRIEADARDLKAAHSVKKRWQIWCAADEVAKMNYDISISIARELRARARHADTDRTP